ncbi:hypothetical protein B0H65DRAFT_589086 [Neurospora tetraspora]|uniref:Uncharacterized protein n=1 Tax=Neurospora tetraspora TaxID=94610 RepID=A0AAE0MRZ2_9PEZI|nr:hypothetical protein B0H65DRAFT_589086 [Neurospora tetraspora]
MSARRYTIDELKELHQPSMPALQMTIHTTQREGTTVLLTTASSPSICQAAKLGKMTFKIPPGKYTTATARTVDSSGSTPITATQAAQPSSRNDIDISSEDEEGSQNAQPANSTPFSVYDLKLVFTARSVMDDVRDRDVIVDLETDFFESFDNFEFEVDAGLSSSSIVMLPRWSPLPVYEADATPPSSLRQVQDLSSRVQQITSDFEAERKFLSFRSEVSAISTCGMKRDCEFDVFTGWKMRQDSSFQDD